MDTACSAERRAFLRALTATTAALAMGGCGATDTESEENPPPPPPPPPGANRPPVWLTVPSITFAQGVASSVSIAAYVTDPDGDPLTINMTAGTLPPGVFYDQPNKRFVYDGKGVVASTSGVVLTADDGRA